MGKMFFIRVGDPFICFWNVEEKRDHERSRREERYKKSMLYAGPHGEIAGGLLLTVYSDT